MYIFKKYNFLGNLSYAEAPFDLPFRMCYFNKNINL